MAKKQSRELPIADVLRVVHGDLCLQVGAIEYLGFCALGERGHVEEEIERSLRNATLSFLSRVVNSIELYHPYFTLGHLELCKATGIVQSARCLEHEGPSLHYACHLWAGFAVADIWGSVVVDDNEVAEFTQEQQFDRLSQIPLNDPRWAAWATKYHEFPSDEIGSMLELEFVQSLVRCHDMPPSFLPDSPRTTIASPAGQMLSSAVGRFRPEPCPTCGGKRRVVSSPKGARKLRCDKCNEVRTVSRKLPEK